MIRVKEVRNPGKYLGIRTMWGQSKREVLAFLKVRLRPRIMRWKYHANKDVLIKTVMKVIQKYTMILFLLPKTWCR